MSAKVKLDNKRDLFKSAFDEDTVVDQVMLYFGADYENDANKEWSKYTPAISISMTVLSEIADRYNIGDKITLVFESDIGGEKLAD